MAVTIIAISIVSGLVRVYVAPPETDPLVYSRSGQARPIWASRTRPNSPVDTSLLRRTVLDTDRGPVLVSSPEFASLDPGGRPTGKRADGTRLLQATGLGSIPGMAPVGAEPLPLLNMGALPDVTQLTLAWLVMMLVANAAVCWTGTLELGQREGYCLIQ
jgi:hypothetical protein